MPCASRKYLAVGFVFHAFKAKSCVEKSSCCKPALLTNLMSTNRSNYGQKQATGDCLSLNLVNTNRCSMGTFWKVAVLPCTGVLAPVCSCWHSPTSFSISVSSTVFSSSTSWKDGRSFCFILQTWTGSLHQYNSFKKNQHHKRNTRRKFLVNEFLLKSVKPVLKTSATDTSKLF